MTTLTLTIVFIFVAGYVCIAAESFTKVNKAAVALLMCVLCWTAYMTDPGQYLSAAIGGAAEGVRSVAAHVGEILKMHLGDTAETLFFLMGAMTIVEIVDTYGGFNFVRDIMKTRGKRKLLWRIAFMTFFLSAILDNLTTSIVMIMVLRKLIRDNKERMIFASIVIIAANSGGAFSPIGDVTTIMLWIKGMITTGGVLAELFLPSLVSMVVPVFILQFALKGKLDVGQNLPKDNVAVFTRRQRRTVFFLGVGGLIFVPIFRYLTDLPPFMGILLVLGLLWTVTECFHRSTSEDDTMARRVSQLLARIDMSTILSSSEYSWLWRAFRKSACSPRSVLRSTMCRAATTILSPVPSVSSRALSTTCLSWRDVWACIPSLLPATWVSTGFSGCCLPTALVWEAPCSSSVRLPEWWLWDWRKSPSDGI